jgi:hypothetical protein
MLDTENTTETICLDLVYKWSDVVAKVVAYRSFKA